MNIALIASQGGHSGQMKIIFKPEVIGKNNIIFITEKEYQNQTFSIKDKYFLNKYRGYFFRKDYLSFYPLRYMKTILNLKKIFKKEKIDLIITNGAQLSIPSVIAAKLSNIKSLYIDTVIRVKTPNWSARASYLFSDIFLVQHQNMAKKYGKKARYFGGIL
ncbi:hypothetical protein HYW75_05240 [Candidatus Pacearchaeota archaeon]|nr:hypothetical protein [Candidatus Pacearchaeota archaeon]